MKGRTRHVHKSLTWCQVDQRVTARIAHCNGDKEASAMLATLRKQAIQLLDIGGVIVVMPSDNQKIRTVYRMDSYRRNARVK